MKQVTNFKFAKGQTLFLQSSGFFLEVQRIHILDIVHDWYDLYNPLTEKWTGEFGTVLICELGDDDIQELPIRLLEIEYNNVFTSSRKLHKWLKKQYGITNFKLRESGFFNTLYGSL